MDRVSPLQGGLIDQVGAGSPASKAGLRVGEVITGFNGQPITGQQTLLTALAQAKPGETVQLHVSEFGNTMTVSVQLAQLPANP